MMVREVWAATKDEAFLRRAVEVLVVEHAYWSSPPKAVRIRGPSGAQYSLARYWAHWTCARPEDFK